MANDERRGGIGFGGQHRVDSGRSHQDDDDNAESTRAMDAADLEDAEQPTAYSRSPAPPPPPRAPVQPQRPGAARPGAMRAAPPPPPPRHEEEEEAATRMLDAMDMDDVPMPPARAAQQGRSIDLKVVQGPDRGKVHKITDGDHLVGRGLDCQIVLADPAVSRKHFQVRRNGDQVILEDLRGPNGTKVNGEKRDRHVLEPGDQIEIGMSVMEFQIDGQGRKAGSGGKPSSVEERSQRPQSEMRHAAPAEQHGRGAGTASGPGKMIAIAGVLLLLLGGGGVAAWLVLGKKSADTKPEESEAGSEGDITKLIADATKAIEDKDFIAATGLLKKAGELDKGNSDVAKLKRKASGEEENQATLKDADKAIEEGNLEDAIAKLTDLEGKKDSVFNAKAVEQLKSVKETLIKAKLDEAKKAQAAGNVAKAVEALKVVLEHDAGNAEATMLQASLGGAAAPPPPHAADAGATGHADAQAAAPGVDPKAAAVDPKTAAVDSKAAEAAGAKKADFQAGLSAYQGRQWSAAVQAFDAIASGPFSKEEKKKAAAYLAAVKQVEAAANEAQATAGNPNKAAGAWKNAREADGNVNGAHKAFFTDQVIKSYIAAAKAARAAGNCGGAVEAAEEANNYTATGSHPDAKSVIDGCKADGKKYLDQAEAALAAGKGPAAKELAQKAEKILGPMDPLTAKAKEIQKKAAAAGRDE